MNKSILIVEDEKELLEVYNLVLTYNGYTVHTANNGVEGLMQIAATKPDLVLLDMFMPVMDGKDFLKNLDNTIYPYTKIIVYTNLSDRKTEAEMLNLGACRFVLKASMTPTDLITLVKEVINEK